MSKVYVANSSIQRHEFRYRLPEASRERVINIEPMSQAVLPDDFSPDQLASLVEQHQPYGFVESKNLRAVKLQSRTALMYSVGSPVSSLAIESLFQMNKGVLDAFGRQIRQETAIVSNKAVSDALDEQRQQGLQANVRQFEMSIVEDEPASGYTTPTPIAEGYRVSSNATDGRAARFSRKGKG